MDAGGEVPANMAQPADTPRAFVLSYLGLRKAIGCIGTALPFVLALGWAAAQGAGLQNTLSGYYYTGMRDVVVGSLCAIAVFLLSYRGYDRRDDVTANLACLSGLGVALLPTAPDSGATLLQQRIGWCHYALAALFLLTLAYFSLVLFRRTAPGEAPAAQKRRRNAVYLVCGVTMLLCLAAIALLSMLPDDLAVFRLHPKFWLESGAIVAFGVSWLTKGQAILGDLKP